MKIIWLAVSVTMLVGEDDTGQPAFNVVPSQYFASEADCNEWRDNRLAKTWGSVDPVTDRAATAYLFKCIPQDPEQIMRNVRPFMANEAG